ncbi:unnamed protein product [Orchesella dallaii]|uniref:Cathepsin L n=1 Tax=Orchesella dallaii TaxID=48710 RepID=A0ABP1QWL5_9HEXA
MENILGIVFLYASLLLSFVSSEFHIDIDDILNSDFTLFPNQTVFHQTNFEDQTLEHFIRLLEDEDLLESAYSSYKFKFGEKKVLSAHGPFNRRIHVFKDNLIEIFHHNLRTRMRTFSSYEMGVNGFADMSIDEFREEKLGLVINEDFLPHDYLHIAKNTSSNSPSPPKKFDWRDFGIISGVNDQMGCGACVMFAITNVLQGVHAIKNNKEIVDLSEQHILDCAIKENGYVKNKGCEGNTYPDTFQFAIDHGLTHEHLYPYSGVQGDCKKNMQPITRMKSYERINASPEDLKTAVHYYGPAAMGIYVYRGFMLYKSGIYEGCFPGSQIGGHAMAVVGYNDEEKQKYYVLKNQWGEDWGEKGFARYTSTDPRCGMEKLAYTLHI